jgi:hypothetical protein
MNENLGFANRQGWSDVDPFEVIEKVGDTILVIRRLRATLDPSWSPIIEPGGFAGHCTNNSTQRWIYASDPNLATKRIRRHKNGQWKDPSGDRYILAAAPRKFHDYNF